MWSVVATWPFSLEGIRSSAKILASGGTAADAAEAGVRIVESDPTVQTVGCGSFLNLKGELELDAAFMDGDTLKMGVVAGIHGYEHPVTIARAVMEKTRHSILVGAGAEDFARQQGIPEGDPEVLIPPIAREIWEKNLREQNIEGHDTIGLISLDTRESMVVATSTSGASLKLPGRVGDSPIIGSGFYVESGVGGAAATGLGEDIMRTCCTFRVVELMRGGMAPKAAAEEVVRTAHERIIAHGGKPDCIALVCMNAAGEWGGAANHKGFAFAYATEQEPEGRIVEVTPVIDKDAQ